MLSQQKWYHDIISSCSPSPAALAGFIYSLCFQALEVFIGLRYFVLFHFIQILLFETHCIPGMNKHCTKILSLQRGSYASCFCYCWCGKAQEKQCEQAVHDRSALHRLSLGCEGAIKGRRFSISFTRGSHTWSLFSFDYDFLDISKVLLSPVVGNPCSLQSLRCRRFRFQVFLCMSDLNSLIRIGSHR